MDFWLLATAFNFIAGFIKIGECTLTCLKGDNLPMARDSNTVQQCGSHEFCSLEQFITPNGFIRHKASCKDSQVCGGSTVPGTYMVVCSECCDTDLCSASGCNSNGYNRTRGHICYHCDYPVDDPKQCDKIRICSYDQVCGMHQTPYGQYNMGCESKATCAAIQSLGVCSTCCSTDLCNRQCTVQAGTTRPPVVSCQDSKDCKTISTAVAAQGLDVCQNKNLKHFCNYTCGLCPGQTTNGPLSTGTSNSATSSTATTPATAQTTAPNHCNSNPCIHGSCIPTATNYVCACSPGYTGVTCDKIDQCHSKPCVHGTCVAIPGSFHCTCHNNFTGRLCDSAIVVNPCSPNPCVHGTCSQSGQTYTCSCNSGYSGPTCAVQDPCSPNPCTHGQCSKTGSTFSCSCNSGYTGTTCSQVQSPCSPNPCVHGSCTASGSSFSCKCNSGFMGNTCNVQDPCSAVPCIHGNCSSTSSGGYHCHCTPGYTGVACDTDIDECKSNPCLNGVCQDKINGYTCSCYAGYTGQQCKTDIDECQSTPCVHGLCHNEINGYTCRCYPGYTGKQCSIDIDNCAQRNPCHHHGTCHDQVNGFSCTCKAGYSGTTCNQQAKVRDCKDALDFGLSSNDGIQSIDLGSSKKSVYCDMTTTGGGWTVVLYRKDSQVDFLHPDSNDYALGFGNKHTDFWQGLEDMHALTSDGRRYQLRVDMTAANGTNYYEIYDDFHIGPAKDFTLHIGSHRGTAGDSLSGHNGFGFTTSDRDVDSNPGTNCAKYLGGSWWFHDCFDSCLTCEYVIATPGTQECASMSWNAVRYCEPLRMAKMMIRPM